MRLSADTTSPHASSWFDKTMDIAGLGATITVAALNRNRGTLAPPPGTSNPSNTSTASTFPWGKIAIALGVGVAIFFVARAL